MNETQQREIAQTILNQIEMGVKWSIGFRPRTLLAGLHKFQDNSQDYGVMFAAKPRHRIRYITITLNAADLYDVRVLDQEGNIRITIKGIFADQLNQTLLDLENNKKA